MSWDKKWPPFGTCGSPGKVVSRRKVYSGFAAHNAKHLTFFQTICLTTPTKLHFFLLPILCFKSSPLFQVIIMKIFNRFLSATLLLTLIAGSTACAVSASSHCICMLVGQLSAAALLSMLSHLIIKLFLPPCRFLHALWILTVFFPAVAPLERASTGDVPSLSMIRVITFDCPLVWLLPRGSQARRELLQPWFR